MSEPAPLLAAVLRSICAELPNHEQRLNELDSAVGDGDHGQAISRCARAIEHSLDATPGLAPADILLAAGRAVVATVGGASGALIGSALMAAARAPRSSPEEQGGAARAADLLDAACREVAARGRAAPGDKTMLDALQPAAATARAVAEAGGSVAEAVGAAADAAESGAAATGAMIGRAGRAGRLGDRSLGHVDPGAVSTALMLRIAAEHVAAELARESSAAGES
jgi:phosphoenolpyruvate---glycerone phosphotransferase subunit DhaL